MEKYALLTYTLGMAILFLFTLYLPYPSYTGQTGISVIEGDIIAKKETLYGTQLSISHKCVTDAWIYEPYNYTHIKAKIQKNTQIRVVDLLSPN